MECENKSIPLAVFFSVVRQQYFNFLNKILENENINAGQATILIYLTYNEKVCQEDIAKHYKIDKGTVARGIKKLEELNLVFRKFNEKNRRKYNITLSEKGRKLGKKIIEANTKWDEMIYSEVDISKEMLNGILEQIVKKTIEINKMEDINGRSKQI